jgi:hypothetical protein
MTEWYPNPPLTGPSGGGVRTRNGSAAIFARGNDDDFVISSSVG